MQARGHWLLVALLAVVAAAPVATPAAAAECFRWSQKVVSLGGVLQLETFPGPPNFDAIHRGDASIHEFVLELERPLCVEAASEAAALKEPRAASVSGQRRVQVLMADARVEVVALGNLGERVWLHGHFAPPSLRTHYLPVLLQAKRISILPAP